MLEPLDDAHLPDGEMFQNASAMLFARNIGNSKSPTASRSTSGSSNQRDDEFYGTRPLRRTEVRVLPGGINAVRERERERERERDLMTLYGDRCSKVPEAGAQHIIQVS